MQLVKPKQNESHANPLGAGPRPLHRSPRRGFGKFDTADAAAATSAPLTNQSDRPSP